MENINYTIDSKLVVDLLGKENFSTEESAVLELVKNAYDALAKNLRIIFLDKNTIQFSDDGIGMSEEDIRSVWMNIGTSQKGYDSSDNNGEIRVQAGEKGVGRFALSRLGAKVILDSKKQGHKAVRWKTDWQSTEIGAGDISNIGTHIKIEQTRVKWNSNRIKGLSDYLSKLYNDEKMRIEIVDECREQTHSVGQYFKKKIVGIDCLASITASYSSQTSHVSVEIVSDEFTQKAQDILKPSTTNKKDVIAMVDELENDKVWKDLYDVSETKHALSEIGDFSFILYFNTNHVKSTMKSGFYNNASGDNKFEKGVFLYRNAFGISGYEASKDWLGLNARRVGNTAAATHPTGLWTVSFGQISGKVEIDKKINRKIQDLSNRQNINDDIHFKLLVRIVITAIRVFERHRQNIIRKLDAVSKSKSHQNDEEIKIINSVVKSPTKLRSLTSEDAIKLANEIKEIIKKGEDSRNESQKIEANYRYDVRILNTLATIGLKTSAKAHEVRNYLNILRENVPCIIKALKNYGLWEIVNSQENTKKKYKNVPKLLEDIQVANGVLVELATSMLEDISKKSFDKSPTSLIGIINRIAEKWKSEYSWVEVNISVNISEEYRISEDIARVIFDNLILNSIQQNIHKDILNIDIVIKGTSDAVTVIYRDNGVGLVKAYLKEPFRILEVHETSRDDGHGLGMWIVHNSIRSVQGGVEVIDGSKGFLIEFRLGETR